MPNSGLSQALAWGWPVMTRGEWFYDRACLLFCASNLVFVDVLFRYVELERDLGHGLIYFMWGNAMAVAVLAGVSLTASALAWECGRPGRVF